MAFVKSTDPIKKMVVRCLKVKSGGSKVTVVQKVVNESGVHFYGRCHKYLIGYRRYTDLGMFCVSLAEIELKLSENEE